MNLSPDNTIPFIEDDGSIYLLMVSPPVVVERTLELAALKPNETLYDLGSGKGCILIYAARKYGAKAVGIELNKELFEYSKKRINELGLDGSVQVIHEDLYESDISDADVVTMYLGFEDINEQVKSKLERKLMEGSRIITINVSIPGWNPTKLEKVRDGDNTYSIHLYQIESEEILKRRRCWNGEDDISRKSSKGNKS